MAKRILLADDSITIQKVVELTFSDGDYEVTAVNNGAKAVLKLGEMRPDIILSDIIMPEKNGYEVCEYVKSHPEYRNIPVVLLTGTFEPFDPDRAEKAGCDAVVTKPFESQSLIHKVEELIAQSRASSAAPAPSAPEPAAAPETSASPWMDDVPVVVEAPASSPSPFTTSGGSFPVPPVESYTHGNDIFGAAPPPMATTEMPFDAPAESPFAAPPAAPEPSPWDEQDFGGETRAFGKMTFDDLQAMQPAPAPEPSAPEADMPFGAPPEPEQFSSETRAFQRMSFDELQQQMATPAPPAPEPQPEPEPQAAMPEASPWDEPAATPFEPAASEPSPFLGGGGETRAFPAVSFDQFQQSEPEPPAPIAESSPWDEPATGGETRAFPSMSFDDLAAMSAPAASPEPELSAPEPEIPLASVSEPVWAQPAMPAWSETEEMPAPEAPLAVESFESESFSTAAYAPFVPPATEPEPVTDETLLPEIEDTPIVPAPDEAEADLWTPAADAAEATAAPSEPAVPQSALAPETPSIPIRSSDLTEEQVDRIARRVVELMSDQVVRNIAWEVIPDLAEMVVKERIRQLESE